MNNYNMDATGTTIDLIALTAVLSNAVQLCIEELQQNMNLVKDNLETSALHQRNNDDYQAYSYQSYATTRAKCLPAAAQQLANAMIAYHYVSECVKRSKQTTISISNDN